MVHVYIYVWKHNHVAKWLNIKSLILWVSMVSRFWTHRRRIEEQIHLGLIVSRRLMCRLEKVSLLPSATITPAGPSLSRRSFTFFITFFNPPGRLCTQHIQTHANICTHTHTQTQLLTVSLHCIPSRWIRDLAVSTDHRERSFSNQWMKDNEDTKRSHT